jgi:hypothetical protein
MAETVKLKTRCRFPVPEIKLINILCTFKKICKLLVNRVNDLTLKGKTSVSTPQIRMALCRSHDFRNFIKIKETLN